MTRILFVAPTQGNGGIASWAANFRKNCPKYYELLSIGVSLRRSQNVTAGKVSRIVNGLLDMFDVIHNLKKTIQQNPDIKIMHLTVSGVPGSLRDYFLLKVAKKRGLKCIMHCHFGSVTEQVKAKGFFANKLRAAMTLADQIWVLDNKSLSTLQTIKEYEHKAILVPNFLDVPEMPIIKHKTFTNIAFVGNLFPTKGIFELVQAISSLRSNDTKLHIIGPGLPEVIEKIKKDAGAKFGNEIKLYGRVPNTDAVKLISSMDIIALPTYYDGEAFPISILEAMSRGKMVISCDRGAIKDMLTYSDGTMCGMIVTPKNPEEIKSAILWCQEHPEEANVMCQNAYKKVYDSYRTDVAMRLYVDCYKKLEA